MGSRTQDLVEVLLSISESHRIIENRCNSNTAIWFCSFANRREFVGDLSLGIHFAVEDVEPLIGTLHFEGGKLIITVCVWEQQGFFDGDDVVITQLN